MTTRTDTKTAQLDADLAAMQRTQKIVAKVLEYIQIGYNTPAQANIHGPLMDLHGAIEDAVSEHLKPEMAAIQDELDRRDAAIGAQHERGERAWVRS